MNSYTVPGSSIMGFDLRPNRMSPIAYIYGINVSQYGGVITYIFSHNFSIIFAIFILVPWKLFGSEDMTLTQSVTRIGDPHFCSCVYCQTYYIRCGAVQTQFKFG